jgi:hypothetical protein
MSEKVYMGWYNLLNTETEILVKVILRPTGVRERDVVHGEDRRRELLHVLKAEIEGFWLLNLLHKTGSLHLVDNLLLRLGLFDEIGVSTGRGDESEVMSERDEGRDWV